MREIKFRAWNKENNKLVYFDLFDNDENYLLCGDDSFHIKNDTPIMQFTGLKDSKGVEIYEGDILKNINDEEWKEIVEWSKIRPMFSPFQRITSIDSVWLIIGNIYENPELLT